MGKRMVSCDICDDLLGESESDYKALKFDVDIEDIQVSIDICPKCVKRIKKESKKQGFQ